MFLIIVQYVILTLRLKEKMKILIVSGYFPPYSPASGSRVNKLSKFLEDQGHSIRVLCPKLEEMKPILEPEISIENIHYTNFFDINKIPSTVKSWFKVFFRKRDAKTQKKVKNDKSGVKKVEKKESQISKLYRSLTNIPDRQIGWYFNAIREGKNLFREWTPDLIFATMPPFTSMLVANRLSKILNVPIIYDYRDLWTGHPYYSKSTFNRIIESKIEKYLIKNATGLVTVTNTWANHLKDKTSKPVEFVMNGFDPTDFISENQNNYDENKITILYAGYLYGNKRDPSALFEALGLLGDKAQNYNILFYLPNRLTGLTDQHRLLVEKYNLNSIVKCYDYIPQKELLNIQQTVDVLLLLRWNHPSEDGVIAGKLFEYIGAGKEILSLGSTTGEAAEIIRNNKFGFVSNNPIEISEYLETLLEMKQNKKLLLTKNPNRELFTRNKQFEKMMLFMEKIYKEYL